MKKKNTGNSLSEAMDQIIWASMFNLPTTVYAVGRQGLSLITRIPKEIRAAYKIKAKDTLIWSINPETKKIEITVATVPYFKKKL